ncbi:homeobox domain-containing protein, partial [Fomitopsis serialis]|uniref:homeobox domain-containing protein n=1 Tax=Fomitopsis serialis TaxID=139415 RepID=UPI0020082F6C
KHRKRTTRDQLKVLEIMFKEETKPSAAKRKMLSSQLGMTPREVQVWFQNR